MRQLTTRTFGIVVTVMTVLLSTAAFAAPGPLTGDIAVSNDRGRAVSIRVDGASYGSVPGHSKRVLRGVPNGIRQVTFVGRHSAETTQRVSVEINRVARLRIAPARGVAAIRNNSGVKMSLRIDGRNAGRLGVGERLETERLRPGTYTLTATPRGRRSGYDQSMTQQFTVRAGQTTRVKLGRYLANLTVTNPFPFPVRARIGTTRVVVRPHSSTRQQVAPGVINVALKRGVETVATDRLTLAPGQNRDWTPQVATTGELSIRNASGATVTVKVNGQRVGRFAPGETRTVRGLSPGQVRVVARTANGRVIREHAEVSPYRDARVSLRSPAPVAITPVVHSQHNNYAHNH